MNIAALRAQVESALTSRLPSPFTYRQWDIRETLSVGIPEIDSLTGGLPRGGLTEIFGAVGSGRTSVLLSVLATSTARAEVCALVDARDALDPHSAEAAGVQLQRLLWVRCSNIEHALRATDLLLQGGGFGLVALDLSDIPPQTVRRVPLNAWFRIRRVIENTPTILLLLEQEPSAKTCASLVLRMEAHAAHWSNAQPNSAVSHSHLLCGMQINVEVVRSRIQRPVAGPASLSTRFVVGARPASASDNAFAKGWSERIAMFTRLKTSNH